MGQEANTNMLCSDFERQLSDYLEGLLDTETNRLIGEHALRCPVCHETLLAVRNSLEACRVAPVPAPSKELEARILQMTVPETAMSCAEFEDFLTDYLDGFLPAPLYHRWERHAALCDMCTELPGEVVRAIGACYTYISEEQPLPQGLNERILQATLGTVSPVDIKAPWTSRLASWLRSLLDPIVSPQFATVATMLLVAVMVLTNTVSADGSISGVYRAGLQLVDRKGATSKQIRTGTGESTKQEQNQAAPAESPRNQREPREPGASGKNDDDDR